VSFGQQCTQSLNLRGLMLALLAQFVALCGATGNPQLAGGVVIASSTQPTDIRRGARFALIDFCAHTFPSF
jgi:hypothetical protein